MQLPVYVGYKQLVVHGRLVVSEMTVRKLKVHDESTAIPDRVRLLQAQGSTYNGGIQTQLSRFCSAEIVQLVVRSELLPKVWEGKTMVWGCAGVATLDASSRDAVAVTAFSLDEESLLTSRAFNV